MTKARQPVIGFIGGGNMARSLVGGLLQAGRGADTILVSDPSDAARDRMAELGAIGLSSDNKALAAGADLLVLAVKPQAMRAVLEPLAPMLARDRPLLVSIAAGLSTAALRRWAGAVPLVRCMPNTPALVGAGMSVLYGTADVTAEGREQAEAVLATAGAVRWVDDEALLDAVTAVSGSGPAYFFHFMEAMIKAGIRQGLDPDTSRELVLQTAFGAARMAQGETDPGTLREQVTSKGGTTAEALAVFAAGDLMGLVDRAVAAAADRSVALARELEQSEPDA
ncbi:MAG: pyrroline-5-carboxylate reductase [Gammaproteobacteria bacterium]|nr:MAG: pyrroline-5-carboxylate reductase [Gammaproteobacteria bacterium]